MARPTNINGEGLFGIPLSDYYLSYRSDVSNDGIMLEVANDTAEADGFIESFLLDATPQTPSDFNDAALLVGTTYSDYDADIHITPIGKGGNDPMPWIDVVVNMGSVSTGEAKAPQFELEVSNQAPAVGESVQMGAMVSDGNATQYAYAWYIDEQPINQSGYLNQKCHQSKFLQTGHYSCPCCCFRYERWFGSTKFGDRGRWC